MSRRPPLPPPGATAAASGCSLQGEPQNLKSPLLGPSSCPVSGYSTCLGLVLDPEGGRVAVLGTELTGPDRWLKRIQLQGWRPGPRVESTLPEWAKGDPRGNEVTLNGQHGRSFLCCSYPLPLSANHVSLSLLFC